MPEKIFSASGTVSEAIRRADDGHENGTLSKAMDNHAFHFFMLQGGKPENWNDDTRANVRADLIRSWRENEWVRRFQRQSRAPDRLMRWIGCTFEIGNLFGVNILDKHLRQGSDASPSPAEIPDQAAATSSMTASTNVTPPANTSLPSPSRSLSLLPQESENDIHSSSSALLLSESATPLGEPSGAGAAVLQRPILKKGLFTSRGESSSRVVWSTSAIDRGISHTPSVKKRESGPKGLPSCGSPAPPDDVLTRAGDEIADSSAAVAVDAQPRQPRDDEVILRDRMLVRVSYTELEGLSRCFDEIQNHYTNKLQYEDWAEFLVVWRSQRVEVYEDYTTPGREFFTGHKKLAFLIPLTSLRTSISLYSFTDYTFCILCPPTPVHEHSKARALFHRSKEGTNVFIFKAKSRTRAQDWIWRLWLRLGGRIPPSIDISCPVIDTRLKLDLPVEYVVNLDGAYDMFSVQNIVNLVRQSMISAHGVSSVASRNWAYLVEQQLQAGRRLELDWRLGSQIDWIWQTEDIQGNVRPWAVLCGLALNQGRKGSHLEIRVAEHSPSIAHLPDGTRMDEPPGVEGYLDRIKAQGQTRQPVYISTRDGNLVALSLRDANPPLPPTAHLIHMVDGFTDAGQYGRNFFQREVQRGAAQIGSAYGVMDLRNVQSARAVVPVDLVQEGDLPVDEDEGGLGGLANVQNKQRLRLRRSFEISLATGPVIQMEAYSCRDCLEWVNRLQALVAYWTHRHRADTALEMDISHSINQRLRVTPKLPKCHGDNSCPAPSESPTDPGASLPALASLYHWCTLSDCKSIVKCGRVFTRKGLRGQYKLSQLILVPGYLILFHVKQKSALYRRRSRDICLSDAYVCSGYLAALALPREEFDPYSRNVPKRYCDGLEAHEPEDDILFMIWYRKTQSSTSNSKTNSKSGGGGSIPPLSAKLKTAVFRTRNKVERDAWCWALGCEIDKLVRKNKDREHQLREMGALTNISR
ncbi:Pleckstrin homology domain-containing protein [Scleroderma citrinum]